MKNLRELRTVIRRIIAENAQDKEALKKINDFDWLEQKFEEAL